MEENLTCFKGLAKDIVSTPVECKLGRVEVHANPQDWDGYTEPNPPPPSSPQQSSTEESDFPSTCGHWEERLTSFQKLIMIKCFEEEKVTYMYMPVTADVILVNCYSVGGFCCDRFCSSKLGPKIC